MRYHQFILLNMALAQFLLYSHSLDARDLIPSSFTPGENVDLVDRTADFFTCVNLPVTFTASWTHPDEVEGRDQITNANADYSWCVGITPQSSTSKTMTTTFIYPGIINVDCTIVFDGPLGDTGKHVDTFTWFVTPIEVTIAGPVRGPGLPPSIPPRVTTDVPVTINPSLDGTNHDIEFDVINSGPGSGLADVTAHAQRSSTGPITLTGGDETSPGFGGPPLKVRARLDGAGAGCATSNGFAVCAHPEAIRLDFLEILSPFVYQGKKYWGARYYVPKANPGVSDSGNSQDLDKIAIKEKLEVVDKTGFFLSLAPIKERPFVPLLPPADLYVLDSNTAGGFKNADSMKQIMDTKGFDIVPGGGFSIQHQRWKYACPRCGIAADDSAPNIPASGFIITKTISKDADNRYWVHVTRMPKGDNGVGPGLTNDSNRKDAEVKD